MYLIGKYFETLYKYLHHHQTLTQKFSIHWFFFFAWISFQYDGCQTRIFKLNHPSIFISWHFRVKETSPFCLTCLFIHLLLSQYILMDFEFTQCVIIRHYHYYFKNRSVSDFFSELTSSWLLSFRPALIILGIVPQFLKKTNLPSLSGTFATQLLESATSPRRLGPF